MNLTSSGPSYNDLRVKGLPISVFAFEDVLIIASERGDIYGVEKPAMLAQLNFVNGDCVLGICLHYAI